ncbi:aldose epimerase family protein [Falsirhodobacter algicola]|uniref:Aldose 1-epimerase n=1 Tax=Falsirhodobacter algicola TaxID=2692330 RepID=A0A8J8MV68_9RHOB|nr:aldose epimerase family protein [Falsirhodobacter algicola]QUS37306.1 galactose-1-epimerase [Falsirhodobacter algicola]
MTGTTHRDPFGQQMERVILRLPSGAEARIITFGAALQALIVPDRDGRLDDVVLGHDGPEGYLAQRDLYGATVGRYANRLAGGRFPGGRVPPNEGPHALHGGAEGFDRRLWTVEDAAAGAVTLSLISPDGDQGFPGRMQVRTTYALSEEGGTVTLRIAFEATSDRDTPISLTNHSYWNLGGHLADAARMRDAMGHRVQVRAARYLPIDDGMIPEGAPAPVAGTPFDFRDPMPLGARIRQGDAQLLRAGGYDHTLCLDDDCAEGARAAVVEDPVTGRRMEMWTDQPGLQLYSANRLPVHRTGKGGIAPRPGDALCLEAQAWPDAPNRPDFPPAILRAGAPWRRSIRYRFSAAP